MLPENEAAPALLSGRSGLMQSTSNVWNLAQQQEPRLVAHFRTGVVPASCRRYVGTSIFGLLALGPHHFL
jgi:hypothetical protein